MHLEVAVLRADMRAVGELALAEGHVQRRGADVDVALGGVAVVDVFYQPVELRDRCRVALPISPNDRLARPECGVRRQDGSATCATRRYQSPRADAKPGPWDADRCRA